MVILRLPLFDRFMSSNSCVTSAISLLVSTLLFSQTMMLMCRVDYPK